jgi:hypothetical protein
MAFCIASDFVKDPYKIPSIAGSNDFVSFESEYTQKVLIEILGYTLWKQFNDGLAEEVVAQKWTDLKNGAVYTYSNKTYQFTGMKKLLTPYLYEQWFRNLYSSLTAAGIPIPKSENADNVSPGQKLISSHNRFCDLVGDECDHINTLYGFLYANLSDYADLDFTAPAKLNVFGL